MSEFVIHNARIVTPEQMIENGFVKVSQGRIVEMGECSKEDRNWGGFGTIESIDAKGQWLVPGFIDIHVHGADGASVMDESESSIQKIAAFQVKHGTTGWLPTTLTAPLDSLARVVETIQCMKASEKPSGSQILGIHLEGPMISPAKPGAQNPAYIISPSFSLIEKLCGHSIGTIKKITFAPEMPGAMQFVRQLQEHGIIPSIGHTDSTFDEAYAAIEAGATHATHLFNAMRGLHHRDGGTVGACLHHKDVICELIADGHHVDFRVLELAVRLKGPKRLMLITDAISATGQGDGEYSLGGLDVSVTQGQCFLRGTNTLAGSTLTMDVAVKNMVSRVGCSLVEAIEMASTTPARELGLSQHKGRIKPGFDADMVLLSEALSVSHVWVMGRVEV